MEDDGAVRTDAARLDPVGFLLSDLTFFEYFLADSAGEAMGTGKRVIPGIVSKGMGN